MTHTNSNPPKAPIAGVHALGWLFVVLGVFSVLWPTIATIAIEQLIAWLFVFSGFSGLLFWFRFGEGRVKVSGVAFAALALVFGLLLVFQPFAGARTLTIFLAALFFVEGVLSTVMAMSLRETNTAWIWALLSGIATLILSVLIFVGWPATSAWVIGLLFGINLVTTGAALIALSGNGRM